MRRSLGLNRRHTRTNAGFSLLESENFFGCPTVSANQYHNTITIAQGNSLVVKEVPSRFSVLGASARRRYFLCFSDSNAIENSGSIAGPQATAGEMTESVLVSIGLKLEVRREMCTQKQ